MGSFRKRHQGFTGWGRARGSDPRNTLWKEFWRVVVEARPTVFAIVTTPQFLRSHEFEAMLQTIDQERSTAFRLTYGVVQAADFGVAQDRRHAVIIGSQTDGIPLPVPTHGGRHGLPRVTVHNALGGLAAPEVHVWDFPTDTTNLLGQHVHGTFRSHHLHVGRRVTLLSQQRYQHIPPGGDVRDLPEHLLSPHYLRRGPRAAAAGDLGRMRWDAPAPAIRVEFLKPEKGRYLHPEEHRAITHYEAALLQGFPPDYLWCGSRTEIARLIGDATPVRLAAALARHIKPFVM